MGIIWDYWDYMGLCMGLCMDYVWDNRYWLVVDLPLGKT
jgi:hypothetical protein